MMMTGLARRAVSAFTMATAVASLGMVQAAPATGRTSSSIGMSCILHLNVNPVACARYILSRQRPVSRSWISATAGKTLLYASEPYISTVSVSVVGAKGLAPIGQLTFNGELPLSMAVDSSKNVYVALLNPNGPQNIEVFPRGSTKPSRTYTNGIGGALNIAIDSHDTLYVANFVGSNSCNVLEYAKGSMKPTRTITDVPGCPNGVGVDANANLYVTYIYYPPTGPWQTDVMKYAAGSTTGTRLHLKSPGPGLSVFYGVTGAANGDVVVGSLHEGYAFDQILTYHPGSQTPASRIEYGNDWYPLFFALAGDRLFAPAFLEQGGAASAGILSFFDLIIGDVPAEFAYPSGRELLVESPVKLTPGFYYAYAISP
jgi:hypothetical protein